MQEKELAKTSIVGIPPSQSTTSLVTDPYKFPKADPASAESGKNEEPKNAVGKAESKPNAPFVIYECYKPRTHEEAREYIDYILGSRTIIANEVEEADPAVIDNDSGDESLPRPAFPLETGLGDLHPDSNLRSYIQDLDKKFKETMGEYLRFDSNFECGNLERAAARSALEYDLYVSSDTNAANRCQWFYFAVGNTRKDTTVKFNVLNLTKFPHFIKEGMKPLVFSEIDNNKTYISWTNKTDRIQVFKTSSASLAIKCCTGGRTIPIEGTEEGEWGSGSVQNKVGNYYTLSFTHTFKYDNDRVYFAFWKPYSYTRLQKFLVRSEGMLMRETVGGFSGKPVRSHLTETRLRKARKPGNCWFNAEAEIETRDIYYKREQLCLSLGGVPVNLITITASSHQTECPSSGKRSYVVITARVHADETAGSYKVQGLIRFLLGKDPVAAALRQEHIFLIVPMLNPDGVVVGNSRCSLGGCDLNRCWGTPSRLLQPTVFQLKAMLSELCTSKRQQIHVYCDFHGHSQMLNSFMFACHTVSSSTVTSWTKVRLLPRIFSKKCHILKYQQCRFQVEPDKLNTARVIVWKEFGVFNSFTLETSQYAYSIGEEMVRFTEKDYQKVAVGFLEALNEYGKLVDQFQREVKGNPYIVQQPDVCYDQPKPDPKSRGRHGKLKIRVQMTRIPAFHKMRERVAGNKTFDSSSNNTENESSSSKNCAGPSSGERTSEEKQANAEEQKFSGNELEPGQEAAAFNDAPSQSPSKQVSWKDYFNQCELEEIADGLQSKERCVEDDDEEEVEILRPLPDDKYAEENKENPAPESNPRLNFEYKDLGNVVYIKKSREVWDSCSSRILRVSPDMIKRKVQKKIITQGRAIEPKRSANCERPPFIRPGTSSVAANDRNRLNKFLHDSDPEHRMNIRRVPSIPKGGQGEIAPHWDSLQTCMTTLWEQPRSLIVKFPQCVSQVPQSQAGSRPQCVRPMRVLENSGIVRACLVPAENCRKESMRRTFQIQREGSVKRHRPSMETFKQRGEDVAGGAKNCIPKGLFTNSTIRERILGGDQSDDQ